MTNKFKLFMMKESDMIDLGIMRYFLVSEVIQSDAGKFIYQNKYAHEILARFKMTDCKSFSTPTEPSLKLHKDDEEREVDNIYFKEIVGSLVYLTSTSPDILYVVSLISRYKEKSTEMHLNAAKRVLRYVKGIVDYGVFYKKDIDVNFVGYTYSNYAGDIDDRKSTSGYVFMFNSSVISWLSKKQQIVTLSTTEVEFVAATSSASQTLWLRNMFKILKNEQKDPTIINCDNMSTIKLSRNPVMHINVHFHFFQAFMQGKEDRVVVL
ncbi:uncharacterized mitochondrial protein AtMg00810-like [Gossypium hirsutum]|uniref:Uncharacterized mitochondrial protein AtMg00810-like n=1 Tax=Gossypium hirsutum TaxID=3635 RepID=A0A1U8KNZ5_GOSHI|nr:uncharacterized mitochondrial protein AtMg00810-like [Gossypium hirsutum]